MTRARLLLFGKAAAGLLLLGLILQNADIGKVGALLMRANPVLFLLACALSSLAVGVNALRWKCVTDQLDQGIGLRRALIGNFEAMFFNQVLPTSIGGDTMRALRAYDAGMRPAWAVASVIIDRGFGLLFVAGSLVAAFWIGGSLVVQSSVFSLLALLSAAVVLGAVTAIVIGAWLGPAAVPALIRPFMTLIQSFSAIARSGRPIGLVLVILILANALNIGAFWACARAIGLDVGWWDAAIILQGMLFFSIIPISIGGWGLREGAAILLFSSLAVGATAATAASVAFGLTLTVVGIIGAGIWVANGYDRIEKTGALAALRSGIRQFTGKALP